MGLIMGSLISLSIIISFIYLYTLAEKVLSRISGRLKESRKWNKVNNLGKKY